MQQIDVESIIQKTFLNNKVGMKRERPKDINQILEDHFDSVQKKEEKI